MSPKGRVVTGSMARAAVAALAHGAAAGLAARSSASGGITKEGPARRVLSAPTCIAPMANRQSIRSPDRLSRASVFLMDFLPEAALGCSICRQHLPRRALSPLAELLAGGRTMSPKVYEKELKTEDQVAREKLGPRGVPGEPDRPKLSPEELKKEVSEGGAFDGHVA